MASAVSSSEARSSSTDWTPLSVDAPLASSRVARGERAALVGDLDTILARALEPQAEARYPSVDAFASDLSRHLADLPISVQARGAARPGRWRVEGLMLHMRGRWELDFALGTGAQAERAHVEEVATGAPVDEAVRPRLDAPCRGSAASPLAGVPTASMPGAAGLMPGTRCCWPRPYRF